MLPLLFSVLIQCTLASTAPAPDYSGDYSSCNPSVSWQDEKIRPYEACNNPSAGIYGPLQCSDGYYCICKDSTNSQCRQQIDGLWANNSCWECQQPCQKGYSTLDPSLDWNSPNCKKKSKQSGNTGGYTSYVGVSSNSRTTQTAYRNPSSTNHAPNQSNSPSANDYTNGSPPTLDKTPGKLGSCGDAWTPSGWDGIATISNYAYQGSSCMCGNGYPDNAQWTWDTGVVLSQNDSSANSELSGGIGYYSGAVNARMFGTEHLKTEDNNKPYCGHSCGICYDLMTTGINAYRPPVDSASVITIMIVDACYNQNGDPWWCNSLYEAQDKYGCDVHFDIQTDRYNENLAAKGKDYTEWTGGGQIVAYKKRDSCPQAMIRKFEEDCKPYCKS